MYSVLYHIVRLMSYKDIRNGYNLYIVLH